MGESDSNRNTRVGMITLVLLLGVSALTVLKSVNQTFATPCRVVRIDAPDATGISHSTPVRSRGMEIGELKSIKLAGDHVVLEACIKKKVRMLPETRATIEAEGIFGNRFVNVEPVEVNEKAKG